MTASSTPPRYPRRASWVRVEGRGEAARLVDPAGDQVLGLNHSALAIWDLCDGTTSVDEMADAVVEAFAVERPQALADVHSIVDQFHSLSLLDGSA